MRESILGLLLLVGPVLAQEPTHHPVPYPDGYREWKHVKSMLIREGHPLFGAFGGLHHVYANDKAQAGYRAGRFDDGSVIVFELLEAREGGNAVEEGPRKVVGVMRKDARRWARTGGWGFEAFKGDSRNERAVGANSFDACFACHAPQEDHDYVFSRVRR